MKKTPFLSYILAALLAGSAVPQARAIVVGPPPQTPEDGLISLYGDSYVDMENADIYDTRNRFDLYVTGMNNKLLNGAFGGNGMIEYGELILDRGWLVGFKGGEKWTMGNNSRLDLSETRIVMTQLILQGQSIVLDHGAVILKAEDQNFYTMGESISGTADIIFEDKSQLNLNGKTISNPISMDGDATISTGGIGGTINGRTSIEMGTLTKVGGGTLNLQGWMYILELNVQAGDVAITGTTDKDKRSYFGNIQAVAGSTVSLVHADVFAMRGAYNGNLVIGNDSTVTAFGDDAWGYNSSNSLTIEKGGMLDMDDQRWTFAACNKIILAGGEITGQNKEKNISLDFCGGDNVVLVKENSTLSAPIRVRGGDSVTFNVLSGKLLTFSGNIVSNKDFDDDKGTIYKTGSGTMVMSGSSQMTKGSIIVETGTLQIAGGANSLGSTAVSLQNNATLDMGGNTHALNLTVTGTGNTMKNGSLTGTLTLEEGSYLKSESALASWDGPTSIVMNDGSTLELGGSADICINNPSALHVNGKATINNAYLVLRAMNTPNGKYVLDAGVASLEGTGTFYLLPGDEAAEHFDLNEKTANFGIIVWEAETASDIHISNGTIANSVEIRNTCASSASQPNGKLRLGGDVTLGKNASFIMENNTQLDIGGAKGIAWLNPAMNSTIKVSNGRMGLPGAPDNPIDAMEYTLTTTQDGTPASIAGGGTKVMLGDNVTFATRNNTRLVVGNTNMPVYIDVVAEGHLLFGTGDGQTRVHGNVAITHTGEGPQNQGVYDVDQCYWLIGALTAEMGGKSINAGVIGDYNSPEEQTSNAAITDACEIFVASFTGASMGLEASEAVILNGDAKASGKVEIDGVVVGDIELKPDVYFKAHLFAEELEISGKAISGTGTTGDAKDPTWLKVENTGTINATETINIKQGIGGGDITMTAGGAVTLDLLGMEGTTLGSADITSDTAGIVSDTAGITARSFTGGALKATAINGAVTINGAVNATSGGKWELEGIGIADPLAVAIKGTRVSIDGSLEAGAETGRVYIKSTGGDIKIGKNSSTPLSAGDSSTLDSAAGITVLGNVTHGNLKATAGQSITLQNISIDKKDANLRAGGSISAGSFTGNYLEAVANGAVTFHGNVASTDNTKLTGASVSAEASLTSSAAEVHVTSTGGDITIGGDLSAAKFSTLESKRDITIKGNVTKGDLTATAAQSILLKDVSISKYDNDAELTATGGSITAANLDVRSLTAKAAEAVAISGNVASRNNASLKGASVGVNGSITTFLDRTQIESTGGAIVIGGTLSSGTSSTLDSAGDITIGTLDGDGNIISGGDVIHGALTATAANSIKLKDIIIGTNDAELTATGGSITAGAFAGANLEANAKGAVTFNGDVEASGTDEWQISTDEDAPTYAVVLEGSGVSVNGSLSADQNDVTSTAGDINITGTLNAALSSTLDSAGNITLGGNVTGGALTATAANSIQLKDISINANNAALTATGGSITAGDVTAGLLTATAAGTITLNDVAVSQIESQIVSTGADGDVVLNSFSGKDALIQATHGSITVATGVTGSASTNKNNFIAAGSVTFNGATGDNNLEHAIINAPQVNWSNGTTLKDVTVSHWSPPANSPLMLLAAGNGAPQTTLTVNGFLELTDYSTVNGNVVINKQDNIIPAVTVDHSTITGRVSGATELVLNRGRVGSVARGEYETLTVASSGASAITALPDALTVDNLSLNGGSLTVCNQDETSSMGQLLVSSLTVQHNTTLDSNMEMQPSGGQESSSIIFNLSAENETTALLSMSGSLTAFARSGHGQSAGKSNISITLNGDASVEGGKRYALITLASGQKPTFWNEEKLNLTVSGLTQKTDDLFWIDGTLYFQNGGELTRAVWSPETSHQWDTTDLNWLQDGYRYRYKDGVTVVFDDTAFQHDGYEGEVELMNNGDGFMPGDVQVENSQGHNYTFRGDGTIAGTTKLTKDGDGTLTIENANSYSGGTTIHAGTLVVDNEWALGSGDVTLASGIQEEDFQAGFTPEGGTLKLSFDDQTASFGMVTLRCGTVQIANGAKSFNLTVTGKNTRLEGTWDDAFTGTLTMKVGSRLFAEGGVLSAMQRNHIDQIVMENESTLALPAGDDANCRIWINNISLFNVYEGTDKDAPRLEGAYLCIEPGGTYTLGATTGKNINSLQNLRGDNSTAFLLDGSTLDLNRQTVRLNIIVRREQTDGESYITTGAINANVRICNDNTLRVDNVRIGNNTSIVMDAQANMIMSGVAIDAGVTFSMANEAYLDLGGTFALPTSVSLGAFTFTGASATIDNGSLYVERKETGVPLKLGTDLQGEETYVSLHEEASLDLGGHVLSVTEVNMDAAAASATIGNGTVDSGVAVASGKALHLGNALTFAGAVSGSGTLVKDNGGTASISGSMQGFTGSVQVQGGELNIMGIAEAASLKVADVTINSGTLGVYQGGMTGEDNEGTLTIRSSHTLAAGNGATLNANLVMERNSTLDVSATEGAGLLMGSSVTLSKGMMLNDYSADWATWKDGTKYVLFTGVDGLDIGNGNGIMTGSMDYTHWVDAKEYFSNIEESNRYFLCYGGAPDQNAQGILTAVNNGSNVGMVYIMTMPEPTTSTLSLLALAALAARRRK